MKGSLVSTALSDSTYALDFTSHQDFVWFNIDPDPEATTAYTDMPRAVAHLDNKHTIELMSSRITVKISNSADFGLLVAVFRLLKGQPCLPISPACT